MIAALASGVLGQIEGAPTIANGVSAVASLFNSANTSSTEPTAPTPSTAQSQSGHAHTGQKLSDQLQALLLQQQQDDGTITPSIVDDISSPGLG